MFVSTNILNTPTGYIQVLCAVCVIHMSFQCMGGRLGQWKFNELHLSSNNLSLLSPMTGLMYNVVV